MGVAQPMSTDIPDKWAWLTKESKLLQCSYMHTYIHTYIHTYTINNQLLVGAM